MKPYHFVMTVTFLVTGLAASAQIAPATESLFTRARYLETTQGELAAAIEIYRRIADDQASSRQEAARALLRLGDAYAKLGNAQSRQAYERLVRDYADLVEGKSARARLGSARAVESVKTDRVVKAGEGITWGDGRVSPDGRLISYTDWNDTGNLMLHDLAANTDRALTGNKDWSAGNAYSSTFSPDGTQVAYGWRTYGTPPALHANEIRVMTVGRSGSPEPRRIYENPEVSYFNPVDWSPDGRLLAVLTTRHDQTGQIAIVGVADGSFTVLKSTGWRGPSKLFFSPDGKYLAYDLPHGDDVLARDVFVLTVDGKAEHRVVEHPAHDVVMGWTTDGTHLLFTSDRTGEFGLWSVPVSDGRRSGAARLLKPDVGAVMPLGLTAAGVLHVIKDTSTDSLQIVPVDLATGQATGMPAVENFRTQRPDWTPDGSLLAYTTTAPSGVVAMNVRTTATGQLRQHKLPLAYMNDPRWLPDGSALVVYGRDFKGRGGIYKVDAQSGAMSLVALSDLCRVQVSRDGKKVYYPVGRVTLGPGNPTRWIEHDLASNVTRTLEGGNVGGGRELSPDGRVFASVEVNRSAGASTLLLAPVNGGAPVQRLALPWPAEPFQQHGWTPDGRAVIVQATGTQRALWLVPIDGSAPRKLALDLRDWRPRGWRLHPNGTHIAFNAGDSSREVWALGSLAQR